MKKAHIAATVALALPVAAFCAERPQDRWSLSDLYATTEAWNADVAKTEAGLGQFAACKGHLGESAKRFKACLDLEYEIVKRYSRLGTYAGELEAEDTGKPESQALNQKAQVLNAKINEETAFVSPEILAIGKARIDGFFRQEPGLKIYRHPVDDILRTAPHTLDAKGEAIVGTFSLAAGNAGSAYRILSNSDMPWPTVKLSTARRCASTSPRTRSTARARTATIARRCSTRSGASSRSSSAPSA
jgi:Oligoendopeptidase F